MARRLPLNWLNIAFLVGAHVVALAAVVYMVAVEFHWATITLAVVWYMLCGLGVTGGYHRLFSHRAYKAAAPLRAFYLAFGAASVQNSALKWSADHRVHHEATDRDADPYNIQRGFWWAHIGWLFYEREGEDELDNVGDLANDRLVAFQHRHYIAVAAVFGVLLPGAIAALWGDLLGGVLVAGFLRLVLQWHATFSVNSVAHLIGDRPYCLRTSARDSIVTALISLGEGYHNFHHRFAADYRNGLRWFHFDPTKWFVWTLSRIGITWDLKRTPREAIERARASVASVAENLSRAPSATSRLAR